MLGTNRTLLYTIKEGTPVWFGGHTFETTGRVEGTDYTFRIFPTCTHVHGAGYVDLGGNYELAVATKEEVEEHKALKH